MSILTVNAGSSTIKFAIFEPAVERPVRVARASVDLRHAPDVLQIVTAGESRAIPLKVASASEDRFEPAFGALESHFAQKAGGFQAVGHRVVHGGDDFSGPERINDTVLSRLEALVPLAPLHQPQNLHAIRVLRSSRADILQVAAFDTAFHQTLAPLQRRFALPRMLFDAGVKRYGFHGLSYAYIVQRLRELAPQLAEGRVIVAHLGSGASLCALENGISRDTSMGFSTLDGLPMATRCGTLDAGVLLHLLAEHHYTEQGLADLLYRHSGLLGLSGVSADIRDLLADRSIEAMEAIDYFCARTAREIAALATTLGGLDTLVFTAGIGEHQPVVRSGIAAHLRWLGLTLDPAANGMNAPRIDSPEGRIAAFVIPTDEESVIADETCKFLPKEPHP
jgi:acetate kinase